MTPDCDSPPLPRASRPGRREVISPVTYYDTEGKLQTVMTTGPDRRPAYVRYRAVAPSWMQVAWPYFPRRIPTSRPRDYTTTWGTSGFTVGPEEADAVSWGLAFDTP